MIFCHQVAHIARRVLVQLLILTKDEDCYIDGAEHGKLVRLLEQTTFSLEERAIYVGACVSRAGRWGKPCRTGVAG